MTAASLRRRPVNSRPRPPSMQGDDEAPRQHLAGTRQRAQGTHDLSVLQGIEHGRGDM